MDNLEKHRRRFRRIFECEIPAADHRSPDALAGAEMLPVQLLIAGLRGETGLDEKQRLLLAEAEACVSAMEPGRALTCLSVLLFGAVPF
jgi:hypothetical protein